MMTLWKALEAGDTKRANAISMPLTTMIAKLHSLDAFLAAEKHLLVRQGVFLNQVIRGPVGYSLDDTTKQEIDRLYDQLQEVLA